MGIAEVKSILLIISSRRKKRFEYSEIYMLINSVIIKNCPNSGRNFVALPIYRKADKSYCSNCKGMSLVSAEYKIIPYILPFKLMPYVDKMKGNQHCGF
jgi:hypothetical protein